MSWLRLDDGFPQHPKVAALTDRQFRDLISLLAYCARYRTFGTILGGTWRVLGINKRSRDAFLAVGLIEPQEGGYRVHDWEHYNPMDPTNAERQARYRERQSNAQSNGASNEESNALSRARVAPSRTRTPKEKETSIAQNRKPDVLWDALIEVVGSTPETGSERGAWNRAVKEIREAGGTPYDIHSKAETYRKRWPEMSLTPSALAKHWGALESGPASELTSEQRVALAIAETDRREREAMERRRAREGSEQN